MAQCKQHRRFMGPEGLKFLNILAQGLIQPRAPIICT